MSELYCILTLQLNYPPEYVLDNMQMYEIQAVMEYQHLKHKDSWEQARLISYLIAQTNSTKKLTFKDIIEFSWEKQDGISSHEITKEDIDRLRNKAREIEKMINS